MPSLQDLPLKVLQARWFKAYGHLHDLNSELKHARQVATSSPYHADKMRVMELEKKVAEAAKQATRLREAYHEAKERLSTRGKF